MAIELGVAFPESKQFRCQRHMKAQLGKTEAGRASIETYDKMLRLNSGDLEEADILHKSLPKTSPLNFIDKEQWCPAYLEGEPSATAAPLQL